jgi:hypothetical protein
MANTKKCGKVLLNLGIPLQERLAALAKAKGETVTGLLRAAAERVAEESPSPPPALLPEVYGPTDLLDP